MPGYDISRFVEKKAAKDLKDMACSLCQDIFCNPMMTNCCNQTFCFECIKAYVDSNRTCPFDQKPLKTDQLVPPPASITSLLNSKKIKCTFASKGCTEIVTVENIENHEKYCMYDKELCKECGFVANIGHDCLKSLLDFKQNMSTIMDKLRKELEDANALGQSLQSQTENYSRTIKDLTLDRTKQAASSSAKSSGQSSKAPGTPTSSAVAGSIRVRDNKDLLLEARKYINNPVVDGHKTRKDTVDKVTEVVKEAITSKGDQIYDVSRFIKEYLDLHYMGDWNVYIWHNNIGFIYYNGISDGFIEIKFGKVTVAIYKTFDSLGFNRMMKFIKSGVIRDFVVSKTGFDDVATLEIEKVALACLKTANDMNDFSDKVSTELMTNYGGIWHCFIYKSNFGFYRVRCEKDKFCLLSSADVKILIFQ